MTDPTAVPYIADAWSGTLTPVANYSVTNGRLKTRISAEGGPDDDPRVRARRRRSCRVHATATDADERARRRQEPRRPRRHARHLHDDARRRARGAARTIGAVRAPLAAHAVDARRRRLAPGRDAEPRPRTSRTRSQLDGLKAWSRRSPSWPTSPASARYTTTFEWDGCGAYLELGEVFDTYRVTINGRALPPADQLVTTIDAGPYLRQGHEHDQGRGRDDAQQPPAGRATSRYRTQHAPELRPGRPGAAGALRRGRGLRADRDAGRRRRHGAGRRSRSTLGARRQLRRVHARRATRSYDGVHDGERDLHGGRRGADDESDPGHLANGAFTPAGAAAGRARRAASWTGPVLERRRSRSAFKQRDRVHRRAADRHLRARR